jgi:hypothetical protein
MKARIEPAGPLTTWWPLAGSDHPGAAHIANRPLRDLQLTELRAAGLELAAGDEEAAVTLRAHAWVVRADWELFLNEPESAALVAPDGTVLAARPTGGAAVEARNSFALVHPASDTHPLGHPRQTLRGQRPPPHEHGRQGGPDPQRHHRELRQPAPGADPAGLQDPERDGHGGAGPPDPEVLQGLPEDAVREVLGLVTGAYGIAVVHQDEPGRIVAPRWARP